MFWYRFHYISFFLSHFETRFVTMHLRCLSSRLISLSEKPRVRGTITAACSHFSMAATFINVECKSCAARFISHLISFCIIKKWHLSDRAPPTCSCFCFHGPIIVHGAVTSWCRLTVLLSTVSTSYFTSYCSDLQVVR